MPEVCLQINVRIKIALYWGYNDDLHTWLRIKQVHGNSPGLASPSESPRTWFSKYSDFFSPKITACLNPAPCHMILVTNKGNSPGPGSFLTHTAGSHKLMSHCSPENRFWSIDVFKDESWQDSEMTWSKLFFNKSVRARPEPNDRMSGRPRRWTAGCKTGAVGKRWSRSRRPAQQMSVNLSVVTAVNCSTCGWSS